MPSADTSLARLELEKFVCAILMSVGSAQAGKAKKAYHCFIEEHLKKMLPPINDSWFWRLRVMS